VGQLTDPLPVAFPVEALEWTREPPGAPLGQHEECWPTRRIKPDRESRIWNAFPSAFRNCEGRTREAVSSVPEIEMPCSLIKFGGFGVSTPMGSLQEPIEN
jgi:hypothetical protein